MGIKARLTSDEFAAVSKELQALYTKTDDGSYLLGVDDAEDVYAKPLKNALDKERESRKKDGQTIQALRAEADKYKDIDPVKAREALDKIDALDSQKLIDEGKLEEVVTKRTEKMRQDLDSKVAAAVARAAELEGTIQARERLIQKMGVEQMITAAATKANVKAGALTDVLNRARSTWKYDIEHERAVAYQADGETIMYGKKASEPISPDEWISSLATSDDGKHLFEPNRGTGTVHGQRGPNGSSVVLSREESRNPARYREAQEQANKAGLSLVIQD